MAETRKLAGLLAGLGFSGLEAEVYLALLREPGATGYRVAQLTGKPAPNSYKALDALRAKGAAVLDDSAGSRSYAAVPIGEYLEGLKRGLDSRKQEIEQALAGIGAPPAQGGLYRLASVEQVFERARGLLECARRVALVDAFPGPLEELRPDIARAVKRGVSVFVKAYRAVDVPGCDLIAPSVGDAPDLAVWNGDWLNVVVDCNEAVLAFLKPGEAGVNEAVWSRNAYLGLIIYNGMLHELMMTRLLQMLRQDMTRKEMTPEFRRLSERYSGVFLADDVTPKSWKKSMPERWQGPAKRPKGRRARKPARGQERR
ncbi:MAG: helix-turn-helix domain-containing protein [bacterium]